MVVKPLQFITKGRHGLVQPAVKCHGREYLRGLGTKRSLALREFALDMEALQRFVEKEPLRRVHERVFGSWR
jgi:protein phosphatase